MLRCAHLCAAALPLGLPALQAAAAVRWSLQAIALLAAAAGYSATLCCFLCAAYSPPRLQEDLYSLVEVAEEQVFHGKGTKPIENA